jgi:ketosteroid isomerase-like protein
MSQENVEVVRAQYEVLGRTGDLNREWYDPDATFDASRLPGFALYQGFDQFHPAWAEYRDTFDGWWIEVDELLAGEEDRVFAAVRDGGRIAASGDEVRQRIFHVFEVRGDKVATWTAFLDRAEALKAAGLSE